MIGNDGADDDRGQAYTLEGIIGAMILLTAVLMALNSAVLLPSTSGTIDRGVQSDVGQQASDVLRIADEDGNLSATLRCWSVDDEQFNGSTGAGVAYRTGDEINNSLGTMLEETFSDRYSSYSMEAVSRVESSASGTARVDRQPIVTQGNAVRKSITVTHTVTLYEGQTLTPSCVDDSTPPELRDAWNDDGYPIPPANDPSESQIYNVVEVRLTIIW